MRRAGNGRFLTVVTSVCATLILMPMWEVVVQAVWQPTVDEWNLPEKISNLKEAVVSFFQGIPVSGETVQNFSGSFSEVLAGYDSTAQGYVYDINHDGTTELILKSSETNSFIMYYHDGDSVRAISFGHFDDINNVRFHDVTCEDGQHSFFWMDYQKSGNRHGYYKPQAGREIDVSVSYTDSGQAQWSVSLNGTEMYSGTASERKIPDCTTALKEVIASEGLSIPVNVDYAEIPLLSYEALVSSVND